LKSQHFPFTSSIISGDGRNDVFHNQLDDTTLPLIISRDSSNLAQNNTFEERTSFQPWHATRNILLILENCTTQNCRAYSANSVTPSYGIRVFNTLRAIGKQPSDIIIYLADV
jgi:hypothetical protein